MVEFLMWFLIIVVLFVCVHFSTWIQFKTWRIQVQWLDCRHSQQVIWIWLKLRHDIKWFRLFERIQRRYFEWRGIKFTYAMLRGQKSTLKRKKKKWIQWKQIFSFINTLIVIISLNVKRYWLNVLIDTFLIFRQIASLILILSRPENLRRRRTTTTWRPAYYLIRNKMENCIL